MWAEKFTITGYQYTEVADLCFGCTISAYRYKLWGPCLTFDVILAVLAVLAGVKHSRQQSYSRSTWLNKPRLLDVLILGNVVYFLR